MIITPTYHGIVRIECVRCHHVTDDAFGMEIENDQGSGTCDACGHDVHRYWTVQVQDCLSNDDAHTLTDVPYRDAPLPENTDPDAITVRIGATGQTVTIDPAVWQGIIMSADVGLDGMESDAGLFDADEAFDALRTLERATKGVRS